MFRLVLEVASLSCLAPGPTGFVYRILCPFPRLGHRPLQPALCANWQRVLLYSRSDSLPTPAPDASLLQPATWTCRGSGNFCAWGMVGGGLQMAAPPPKAWPRASPKPLVSWPHSASSWYPRLHSDFPELNRTRLCVCWGLRGLVC